MGCFCKEWEGFLTDNEMIMVVCHFGGDSQGSMSMPMCRARKIAAGMHCFFFE